MRRTRRGAGGGHEFGGSGEDSFVAVVVTKLTGALLFILLLTMVIMALIPKAIDLPREAAAGDAEAAVDRPLEIATPGDLPEAIAGRPYRLALAAHGATGPPRWSIDGALPDGLEFEPDTGQIRGVPRKGTPEPLTLAIRVRDGDRRASGQVRLVVFESDRPLGVPSKWLPTLPAIPWRSWLDQGFGFLVLLLVHLVGVNALTGLERSALSRADDDPSRRSLRIRFGVYRWAIRLTTISAAAALGIWLAWPRGA